jgi:hypothetical protein
MGHDGAPPTFTSAPWSSKVPELEIVATGEAEKAAPAKITELVIIRKPPRIVLFSGIHWRYFGPTKKRYHAILMISPRAQPRKREIFTSSKSWNCQR